MEYSDDTSFFYNLIYLLEPAPQSTAVLHETYTQGQVCHGQHGETRDGASRDHSDRLQNDGAKALAQELWCGPWCSRPHASRSRHLATLACLLQQGLDRAFRGMLPPENLKALEQIHLPSLG
jgi:hypothetical protein